MSWSTVFISYSWENDKHMQWIERLCNELSKHNLLPILDKTHLKFGEMLPDFMENSISKSDFVLIICTPTYKAKADGLQASGVKYEKNIISAELLNKGNHTKFIPVLRKGVSETSIPISLSGKKYCDLRGCTFDFSGNDFDELIITLSDNKVRIEKDASKKADDIKEDDTTDSGKKKNHITNIIGIASVIISLIALLLGDNIIKRISAGIDKEEASISQPESSNSQSDNIASLVELSPLETEIEQLWKDYPQKSAFIKMLINTGIRRYNSGKYDDAGYFFERAIKEGDEGVIAKNNLAFMMRRNEYRSDKYVLEDLLQIGVDSNDTFALINMAAYYATENELEKADEYIRKIHVDASDLDEAIDWWEKLSIENDPEGNLVLELLMKHGYIDSFKNKKEISNTEDYAFPFTYDDSKFNNNLRIDIGEVPDVVDADGTTLAFPLIFTPEYDAEKVPKNEDIDGFIINDIYYRNNGEEYNLSEYNCYIKEDYGLILHDIKIGFTGYNWVPDFNGATIKIRSKEGNRYITIGENYLNRSFCTFRCSSGMYVIEVQKDGVAYIYSTSFNYNSDDFVHIAEKDYRYLNESE